MTFKIDNSFKKTHGFDISIGTGKTFWAKNFEELLLALEHYFRFETGKIHNVDEENCPLCRG